MEAYDAAVLSYALATAAIKGRPPSTNLLGIAPSVIPSSASSPKDSEDNIDPRRYMYQLLYNMEQMIMNKTAVPLSVLMELCSLRQNEAESQIVTCLERLLAELCSICKANSGAIHLLSLNFDDNHIGASLNTEKICEILSDLLRQFGLQNGSNAINDHIKRISNSS